MTDVFPHARVITEQGTPAPVPRYYKELLKEQGQDLALNMSFRAQQNFQQDIQKRLAEDTPDRRHSRTIYAKARTGIFKRDTKET